MKYLLSLLAVGIAFGTASCGTRNDYICRCCGSGGGCYDHSYLQDKTSGEARNICQGYSNSDMNCDLN